MAANAFANVAAAQAAGWTALRTTSADGRTSRTSLRLHVVGQPGVLGSEVIFDGEGVNSAAADAIALANCNAWRNDRYGTDSASISLSTVPNGSATPSSQGIPPTHQALTKDKS